jgi:hypothetical protein
MECLTLRALWNEGESGGESEALFGKWMKERKKPGTGHFGDKSRANSTVPGGGLEHSGVIGFHR